MIIELYGPAGAGKTSFACALSDRLRESGHSVEIVRSYRLCANASAFDPGGIVAAMIRVVCGIGEIAAMACRPLVNANEFRIATRLIRTLPPHNILWFIRISQYIFRLCHCWRRSESRDEIVIFDQAFVQAVCSLAMFSRREGEYLLDYALSNIPKPDLIIRLDAPREVLVARLLDRRRSERLIDRLLEADLKTNLKALKLADRISHLLQERGCRMLCISSLDGRSLRESIDLVEQEVSSALGRARESGSRISSSDPYKSNSLSTIHHDNPRNQVSDSGISFVNDNQATPSEKYRDKLGRSSIISLCLYISGAGLTYAVQLLAARLAGAGSYGIYSYVLAWVTLLAYGSMLGFNVSLMRFIPAYMADGDTARAQGVIRYAYRRALSAALVATILGLLVVVARRSSMQSELARTLAIGFATVPLVTLLLIGSSVARAFGGVQMALAPERIVRDGLVLALIAVAAWTHLWPRDATLIMGAMLISSAAAFVLVTFAVRRLAPPVVRTAEPIYEPEQWRSTMLPITVVIGAEIIMNRAGLLVLGFNGLAREAGIFGLAFSMAVLMTLPRVAVSTMFSPTAAGLYARKDKARLNSLFWKATVLSSVGAAILAIPLLVLTRPLLGWFGSEFEAGVSVVRILVLGQLVSSSFGPQQSLLMMTGHERAAAVMLLTSAGINILTCAAAIQVFGVDGAAVATVTVIVAWNIAMAIFIHRSLGMSPVNRGLLKPGGMKAAANAFALERAPRGEDRSPLSQVASSRMDRTSI